MSAPQELLPCPHCGGPAEFRFDRTARTCWVQCSDRDCGGEWCNEEVAAKFWNRRPAPPDSGDSR